MIEAASKESSEQDKKPQNATPRQHQARQGNSQTTMNMLNGNHRAQAQFDRSKWRIMLLLPTWVLQLALSMTMMGLFAWRLGDSMKVNKDDNKHNDDPAIEIA